MRYACSWLALTYFINQILDIYFVIPPIFQTYYVGYLLSGTNLLIGLSIYSVYLVSSLCHVYLGGVPDI